MGLLCLLLPFVVRAAPPEAHAAAVQQNTLGLRLYQQGDLAGALELFQRAIALDSGYALAHYNAAATMARLEAADECGFVEHDVEGELSRAIALDPGRRRRAQVDADFAQLRKTVAGRRVLFGIEGRSDLARLLEETEWSSASGWGAFGNSVRLRLLPGGRLLLGLREVTDSAEGFKNVVIDHPGSWRAENGVVRIRMDSEADQGYSGDAVLGDEDTLQFPKLGTLVDYLAGACDA
jgi:hypothetical protein